MRRKGRRREEKKEKEDKWEESWLLTPLQNVIHFLRVQNPQNPHCFNQKRIQRFGDQIAKQGPQKIGAMKFSENKGKITTTQKESDCCLIQIILI